MEIIKSLSLDGIILIAAIIGYFTLVKKENRGFISAIRTVGSIFTIIMLYKRKDEIIHYCVIILNKSFPLLQKLYFTFMDSIFKLIDSI